MRERIAKGFALGLTLAMTALAALFAHEKNAREVPTTAGAGAPPAAVVPPLDPPPDAATLDRGRSAFAARACTRCHRLDGVGNPRSPLDGVGARLPAERIRAFIVADDPVRASLGRSAIRAKEAYRDLPPQELDALVALLAMSRERPEG